MTTITHDRLFNTPRNLKVALLEGAKTCPILAIEEGDALSTYEVFPLSAGTRPGMMVGVQYAEGKKRATYQVYIGVHKPGASRIDTGDYCSCPATKTCKHILAVKAVLPQIKARFSCQPAKA